MIYFVKSESGHIKIGHMKNGRKRMRLYELQVGCPYRLSLIKQIGGGYEKELKIHKMFKKFRVLGEWFLEVKEIYDFINKQTEITTMKSKKASRIKKEPRTEPKNLLYPKNNHLIVFNRNHTNSFIIEHNASQKT